jgi:hypothetical protein
MNPLMPQNFLGGLYGLAATRSLPKIDEEGIATFESEDPTQIPTAFGSSLVVPKGVRPEFIKHERRHIGQSDVLGPGYLPAMLASGFLANVSGAGDVGHGMERDAYRSQMGLPVGEQPLGKTSNPVAKFLERYFGATLGR